MKALGIGDEEFRLFMRFLGVENTIVPGTVDGKLELKDTALVIIQERYFEKEKEALRELLGEGRLPIISSFPEMEAKDG